MFEFSSNIRYSEVDSNCYLKYLNLLDYFQDCSVAHSESLHVGTEFLAEHHVAWILIGWQIHVRRLPRLGELVYVQTWPYEMKDFYGKRNFQMLSENREVLAYADSVWVMVDTTTGRPVKVLEELQNAYEYMPRLEMEPMGRKMKLPLEYEKKAPIEVPAYFIDSNHHMNNGRYLQVALAYLPGDFLVDCIQIEYRKEALLGENLYPRVTSEQEHITVVLADQQDKPYCIIRFDRKDRGNA